MARRSEHSLEEIKLMIFQAAETIIDESGFSNLKVRNIAMDIGYTVGSIYMVFDNLADLILQLNARSLEILTKQLCQVENEADPEQCLHKLVKVYLNFTRSHYYRWQMLFEHHPTGNVQLPDWYTEKFESLITPFEIQFKRLDHSDTQNYRALAQAFLGGVHGICNMLIPIYHDDESSVDIVALVELMSNNFIRGHLNQID